MKEKYDVQIILSSGPKDIKRIELGLSIALNCTGQGMNVVIFFVNEAAIFLKQDTYLSDNNRYKSVKEYIRNLLELKVAIEICSVCLEDLCKISNAKNFDTHFLLDPTIKIAGTALISSRLISTRTIVF